MPALDEGCLNFKAKTRQAKGKEEEETPEHRVSWKPGRRAGPGTARPGVCVVRPDED